MQCGYLPAVKGACHWRNSASWGGKTLVRFLYRGLCFNRSRSYLLFGIENKRCSSVLAWYVFPAVILTNVKALPSSAQTIYEKKLTGSQRVPALSAMSITPMCASRAHWFTKWSRSITHVCWNPTWQMRVTCSGAGIVASISMMHHMGLWSPVSAQWSPKCAKARIRGSFYLRLYSGFSTSDLRYQISYNTCKRSTEGYPASRLQARMVQARRWV